MNSASPSLWEALNAGPIGRFECTARPASQRPAADTPPGALASLLLRQVLDEIDYGVMLATHLGDLCFANDAAWRECAAGQTMLIEGNRVQPRQESQVASYLKALAGARLGRRSMLTLHAGDAPVSLAVVPVIATSDCADDPLALLVFGKRRTCEPLSADFFARAHRLTPAETAVLEALCEGLRPTGIAQRTGVAISTVRTQIGSIRLKTGTSSIADLIRMVTALPPIVPTLNRAHAAWSEGGERRAPPTLYAVYSRATALSAAPV